MAITTSSESQVIQSLNVFATSSFSSHSLISTVYVVQNIINAIIKPPMAKIANVFGRLPAFCISISLLVLGYAQMASSKNVQTFAAAQVFYSAGGTGLQILNQVFVADTSSLENRAILSVLPCVPFMINVWIGGIIWEKILKGWGWRWGYGIWCIVLPVMFCRLR
jgi:MFS family permease